MSAGPVSQRQAVDGEDDRARWNVRYRAKEASEPAARVGPLPDPPGPLLRMTSLLPEAGRAVDLAGGDGGGALFMAGRGLTTTLVDVSDVGLERAAALAGRRQLVVETRRFDLAGSTLAEVIEAVGPPTPAVFTCFNYLSRSLLASVATDLPSGCRFLVAIATTTNLERHDRPSERFLVAPSELVKLVTGADPTRVRLLHGREGWADDRHRAEVAVEAR